MGIISNQVEDFDLLGPNKHIAMFLRGARAGKGDRVSILA